MENMDNIELFDIYKLMLLSTRDIGKICKIYKIKKYTKTILNELLNKINTKIIIQIGKLINLKQIIEDFIDLENNNEFIKLYKGFVKFKNNEESNKLENNISIKLEINEKIINTEYNEKFIKLENNEVSTKLVNKEEFTKINNERQSHGFKFERQIIEIILQTEQIYEFSNYTAIHDLITISNNYSIKSTSSNTICFGCPKRLFNYNTINIIIIKYIKQNNYKIPFQIIEMDLNNIDIKKLFFNNISIEEIETLEKYIKDLPNGKISCKKRNEYKIQTEKLNKKSGIIIFNPKVDSKKQRRLQCSISNINNIINEYPELIIYNSTSDLYRNIQIKEVL